MDTSFAQNCRQIGGRAIDAPHCDSHNPNQCKNGKSVSDEDSQSMSVQNTETVTAKDFGMSEPSLLPTSRWYFLKKLRRNIQTAFAFSSVKKIGLEVKFADEKILEAKKVTESSPEDKAAIEKAIENYRVSQDGLLTRLRALKETSENPNVDKLLEKITDRAVKHEKIFADLLARTDNQTEITKKLESSTHALEDTVAEAAKKDTLEKFAQKLGTALGNNYVSDATKTQSKEITNRLLQMAGETALINASKTEAGHCQNKESEILALQDRLNSKTITEKEFLEQGAMMQEKLIVCLEQSPEGAVPKPASENALAPLDDCPYILHSYLQSLRDLEHLYSRWQARGGGEVARAQYEEAKKQLKKRYDDCWGKAFQVYEDSAKSSSASTPAPLPTSSNKEDAKAAARKRCEELAEQIKDWEDFKKANGLLWIDELDDLKKEYDALHCAKILPPPPPPPPPPGPPPFPGFPPPGYNIKPQMPHGMFKILAVQGYSISAVEGETWPLVIDVREPDNSPATPEEGFTVQTYITVPKSKAVFYGNAVFNGSTWNIATNAPKEDGHYRLSIYAYCGMEHSACEEMYGKSRQVEWGVDFTVGNAASVPFPAVTPPVVSPKQTSSGHCDELTNALRDLKMQYQAGKITADEVERQAKPYQDEIASSCVVPSGVPLIPKPAPAGERCNQINTALYELKMQYQNGKITSDELQKLAQPYQTESLSACPSPENGEQG